MTPTNTKQLREFVNDLLQDVDNEARIDTDVANAICDVHAAKLEKLWQAREQEVRNEITTFYEDILRDPIKLNNAMSALSEGNDKGEL